MINRMTSTIALICVFFISALAHNPELPPPQLKVTLVTAWWPEDNQKTEANLPVGEDKVAFEKLLKLPYNLIIFGESALGKFVKQRRSNNTVFLEHASSALKQSWYNKLVANMNDKAKALKKDTSSSVLAFSRMILLGKAAEKDTFNTEEFIWVDHNALNSAYISNILDPKHLFTLFQAFSHNFFVLPVEKDTSIHAFPGIEETLFFQKYDTFVSSQIFGGTAQTISTAKNLYEDMLKVILEYDKKLWNEDVMLGLFADRFPYTVSYMTVEFEAPQPPSRLLEEDTYLDLQKEYDEIKNYELMFELCQLGFLITAALIAYEIFKYLKLKNQLILINSGSHFEMEPPSPAQISTE